MNFDYSIDFDTLLEAYIATALWSSVTEAFEGDDGTDNSITDDHSKSDLSEMTLELMTSKCKVFAIDMEVWLNGFMREHNCDAAQIGYYFWLNSNEHGSGFFNESSLYANMLNTYSRNQKNTELYLGDDGIIYHA